MGVHFWRVYGSDARSGNGVRHLPCQTVEKAQNRDTGGKRGRPDALMG